MIWVFAGDEWHQRGRPKPQLDGQSFKAILQRIASRGAISEPAAGPNRRSSGAGSIRTPVGYATRDDLEESLLPWVVAEDEEVTDSYIEQYNNPRVGSGLSGPPPDFEAPLPSPLSSGQRYSGGGGPGSRAGSNTPAALRQRSTEMAAGPPLFSSRRVSAPSYGGARHSSGSGGSAAPDEWLPSVQGVHRHASLPPDEHPATHTPVRQSSHSFTTGGSNLRQQQYGAAGGSGRHPAGVAQPHLMSLGKQNFIDPKTYKQLVWADLADDEEEEARLEREIARQLLVGAGRSRHLAASAAGMSGALTCAMPWVQCRAVCFC